MYQVIGARMNRNIFNRMLYLYFIALLVACNSAEQINQSMIGSNADMTSSSPLCQILTEGPAQSLSAAFSPSPTAPAINLDNERADLRLNDLDSSGDYEGFALIEQSENELIMIGITGDAQIQITDLNGSLILPNQVSATSCLAASQILSVSLSANIYFVNISQSSAELIHFVVIPQSIK